MIRNRCDHVQHGHSRIGAMSEHEDGIQDSQRVDRTGYEPSTDLEYDSSWFVSTECDE